MSKINRREFLKWTGLAGSGVAGASLLSYYTVPFFKALGANDHPKREYDEVKWAACAVNCGGRCPLRAFVKDGQIKWVETDNTGGDEFGSHQVRACVRGRSNRFRLYNPNRLTHPLKRVGKRGEGKFKKISWDEAYQIIADKMIDIKQKYGNEAFYINYGTGSLGGTIAMSWPPYSTPIARMMNLWGGHLEHYNDYSTANIMDGLDHFYGGWVEDSDITNVEYSKLVVLFGNNPFETRMSGGGIAYSFINTLKKGNAKVIIIDPRYTDTVAITNAKWIPIRPATDAALIAGMAHVMIKNNLHDKRFLDRYCIGFSAKTLPKSAKKNASYEDYVMGKGDDKIEKTPKWASKITGIPENTIVELAFEIAQAKPAYISQGWAPQRHSNGEQQARSIATLACMTGNIGKLGGSCGAREGSTGSVSPAPFPIPENPVKESISMFLWTDAIVRGKEMTSTKDGVRYGNGHYGHVSLKQSEEYKKKGVISLKQPIKFVWNYASNCLINQHADSNKTHKILQDENLCEMIVDINITRTPSNRYADIILPDASHFEQKDFASVAGYSSDRPYIILTQKAIDPVGQAKPIYDICAELSERLGGKEQREKFTEGRTQEQWLEKLWNDARANNPSYPTYQEMEKLGIYKAPRAKKPFIAFEDFIKNPTRNKLGTPSGKIEIYSLGLEEKNKTWEISKDQKITMLPEFISSRETHLDPKSEKYPLQMFGNHFKGRAHSSYWENTVSREMHPQEIWINLKDAEERGIKTGDQVLVYNDRGKVQGTAKVTPKVMNGVSVCAEGAWYMPKNGVDIGGCTNTLTSQQPNPISKGNGQHTILVQIEKL